MQLGQHFMIDEELLSRIVQKADIKPNEVVLEIGSGKGALTKHILKNNFKKLICVEKDQSLTPSLSNLELIHADILDVINDLFFDVVVSNLPYHISEPVFHHLLKRRPKRIIVVVGKQFADKLLKDTIMGRVVRETYDVELIEEIAPEAFDPPPAVDSAFLSLNLKKDINNKYSRFFEHSKSKVKNYILKITEGEMTKKEAREKFIYLSNSLLEKHLYALSNGDFKELSKFIDDYL